MRSPKRTLLVGGILVAAACGLGWYGHELLNGSIARSILAKELAAAKTAGIITSAEEILDKIHPIPASQNAAPIAVEMLSARLQKVNFRDMVWDASMGSDPKRLQEITESMSSSEALLALAQQAASKPGFVVDRDYKKGSLMLTPEFAGLTLGADVLRIRSSLLAREGSQKKAVEAFRESFSLVRMMENDQMWLQFSSPGQQFEKSVSLASSLAWLHPESGLWLGEVRRSLDSWDIPSERQLHRYTLALALETFDAVKGHSRAELGFSRPPDWGMSLISKFSPEIPGKTKIVKGFRQAWSVMDTPGTSNDVARHEANNLYHSGLLSNPTLFQTTAHLGPGDGLDHRRTIMEIRHRKALFEAVYEILSLPRDKARKTSASKTISPRSGIPFKIKWRKDGFTVAEPTGVTHLPSEGVAIPPTRQQWKANGW